ncbi:trichohyalin isoform X1 [Pundamilia nyererei]|uniref:Trichohyalin-like isoform X1 n=1 Tax=Pundamilia nyererei TaxID=303518 RepID=A0A9Y6JJN8_9CICH|nr:PREDICTED: trichohyalin-like isoform X1 [Pundamilia nyererei]XP_013769956.1 PREDICTED: trichohyalin-like isoform X1 [Pundamilia nyererei]
MAERNNNGADRHAEHPQKLLYTDLNDNSSVFGFDHCDRLLDAMDAQLEQLQVLPRKCELNCSSAAPLGWSQSLGKDMGLESEQNGTPMSGLDLMSAPAVQQRYENTEGCSKDPVTGDKTEKRLDRRDKEEIESCREQVIWRLERLLGGTCKEGGLAEEIGPPSDSICTEDFATRFREEMVELTFIDVSMQMSDKAEVTESTNISDSGAYQSKQHERHVYDVERRGSETTGESSDDTLTPQHSLTNQPRPNKKSCVSHSAGANISHAGVKAGASETCRLPQPEDDSSGTSFHSTEFLKDPENVNSSCSPKTRCLAGVPVLSFDTVSIDSDLDTVCTEQVRQHIHKWPGWHSLIRSVTEINGQTDITTQEESESRSTSVQRSPYGPVCNCQRNRRTAYRPASYFSDTDEEMSCWSSKSRPERTLDKMQSEWVKVIGRLSDLRQKCEEEEETLWLKRAQIKDVEVCLSELRQQRKHALQELERLTTETAQMEEEKRTLQSVQRDSRAERKSVGHGSWQLQKMLRQKESCLLQHRDTQEDFTVQRLCKQTPKDGSCFKANNVIMSVLEQEEMERQLDNAKTELFAEQRRAREKLESMQEKLEETCEELQRATEAETSLRNRCACLEEKQMQKKGQIEALEARVSGLQGEVGEHKIRVVTLEKMLAHKELQLLDFQEQCSALQAERDGLKVEQQHLRMQHHKTLKEVEEHAHSIMLKEEEELIKLQKSLQQQKEEVKKHEEELHVEASEKVYKAVKEERRKWEAEKMEALEVQRGILEEQNEKLLESLRSEMQKEKSKALALQHQVMELKTKLQELEKENCTQLAAICKSLKEEHQAELQMAQSHRTVLQLEKDVQLAVKEADRLRVMLEERESSHNQITSEMEQQHQHWTEQLAAECQHLSLLVEQSQAKQSAGKLPPSFTVAEAFMNLKTLREQLKAFISQLHQKLDSRKQTNEQLRKEKEQELSIQRQQLRLERDQALNFLKERLIQEHIEELSSLKWVHMSDGGVQGGGGVAACLRKQLKAKDSELRQVQRSMAEWKGQTAARLALKFEEELTAELERCQAKLLRGRKAPRPQDVRQREPERPEEEMEYQKSLSSPSLQALNSHHSSSDMASFKLIRYLHSKVKQLRAENQAYGWSSPPPDLSGSYLETIPQSTDTDGS